MSLLNLIKDAWIPVITKQGRRRRIRPEDLTEDDSTDPNLEIDWPRADFRAAQMEFLIGLLTTACQPEDDSDWKDWLNAPPRPGELAERLAPYAMAFTIDGPGPSFLQDRGDLGNEPTPIAGLLIEQPGANTEKNNADLFVKRGRIDVLARSTAAIALYTLQTFAPSGGAGHRTGLRGGGPLTTLVKPPGEPTLWRLVWQNVVTRFFDPLDVGDPLDEPAKAFPWIAPTRTSGPTGLATTPQEIHPVQCFWGMPRRIALAFEPNEARLPCSITGTVEPVIVRSYRTRPYGVNYALVPHPLTPTYRVKPDTELLPVHPQPGGIAYRHWLSFVQESKLRTPAAVVAAARKRSLGNGSSGGNARLMLFGYDMDNMKARGFVEAEMPLLIASDAGRDPSPRQSALEIVAKRFVDAAVEVAGLALSQIKAARNEGDAELDLIRSSFFAATEGAFFERLRRGLDAIEAAPAEGMGSTLLLDHGKAWLDEVLQPEAKKTFDRHVPADAVVDIADLKAIERVVAARSMLGVALRGYGPAGRRLFEALGLAPPAKAGRPKPTKAGALS
jgi:CRISPR system Cascade subunit CasA